MKKVILATTLAVIIVLAGFSSVASARTVDRDDLIEQIKGTRSDIPGWLQLLLAVLFQYIIYPIIYLIFAILA